MAKDDSQDFKEGVDFEWVNSNVKTKDGFAKTRRFFSKSEKAARMKPKAEASPEPTASPKKAKKPDRKAKKALRPKARPKSDTPSFKYEEITSPAVDAMGNVTGFSRGGAVRGLRKAKLC